MIRRRFTLFLVVSISLFGVLNNSLAFADLTQGQQDTINAIGENIRWFNTEVDPVICIGSVTNLSGNDNIQKSFNYFVSKGLSAAQSAGIVGNLMQESGVNPLRLQYGTTSDQPPISDTAGWGIAQWTGSGVQKNLITTADAQKRTVGDLDFQLDFLWAQLNSNPTYYRLPDLKAATTPSQAADIFEAGFERADPTAANNPAREKNAESVFSQYGGSATAVSTASSTGSCGNNGAFGGSNFVEYKQCVYTDTKVSTPQETASARTWADKPYGSHTVCSDGCGPSAMAMIITNLTGQTVTPDATAAYGAAHGTFNSAGGGGSLWNIADVIGSHWGLKASPPLGTNITAINQVLQSGGLVLATGVGGDPFTTGGHFIVIRAITSDGKWLTANSAGINSSTPYDPASVVASGGEASPGFNAWGLTKQ